MNPLDGFGLLNGVGVVMLCKELVPGSQDWTSGAEEDYRDQLMVLERGLQAAQGHAPIVAMHWSPEWQAEPAGIRGFWRNSRFRCTSTVRCIASTATRVRSGRCGLAVTPGGVAADKVVFVPMPLEWECL